MEWWQLLIIIGIFIGTSVITFILVVKSQLNKMKNQKGDINNGK